jgi:hypothetical protein
MRPVRLFGLCAALWAAFSFPALAQLSCAPRKAVTDQLAHQYGERLIATGETASGSLVELYAAPDGKSWTLVLALSDGRACLMAAGDGWRSPTISTLRKGKGA